MIGIDNWFVLNNIFGDDFSLSNSILDVVNFSAIGGRLSLDIIVNCKVENPPRKWEKWDRVYVKLDFFGVKEALFIVNYMKFEISSFMIEEVEENQYRLDIQSVKKDKINCLFGGASVQNVKPLFNN